MARILITGVAGLLGSHFSRHMLDAGHHVIGIDDFSGGYREFVDKRVNLYELNLTSNNVNEVFESVRPQFVYHFAAYAAVGLSPFIRSFNYSNNVVASANVINACVNNNVKKIIFTSSMDVYGSLYAPPYNESFIPMPEDPYGIAKYTVELDLKHASRLFDIRHSIVRPQNVFGVYQNIWDKYRNVLGIWIRQTLSGYPLTVFGDGMQERAFSDVKYYMQPFEKLMTVGDSQTYNIGADKSMTVIDAAHRFIEVAKSFGYNPRIVHLEKRDEVRRAFCDHTKAKRELEFKDKTDFETLIRDMFSWSLTQPIRDVKKMNYEIDKNLYSFWK